MGFRKETQNFKLVRELRMTFITIIDEKDIYQKNVNETQNFELVTELIMTLISRINENDI